MRLRLVTVLLLACSTAPAGAGVGVWTGSGPNGGWAEDIEVDPGNPARVYVSSYGGLYRTLDNGASFQLIENGLARRSLGRLPFAIDRASPQRLWAASATGGFFVSTDGGDNWGPSGYLLAAPDCIATVLDGAGTDEVFISSCNGALLRSANAGANFVAATSQPAGSFGVMAMAQDPSNPSRLLAAMSDFASGGGTVWRSIDRGVTWTAAAGVPATGLCFDVAWGAGGVAYAACDSGFFRTPDGGATWLAIANVPFVEAMVVSPANADVVYATGEGVFRIDVAGSSASITALNTGLQPQPGYGGPVEGHGLALHPSFPAPQGLWLASVAGVYRSLDGGATWLARNNGMRANVVRAIAPNPNPSVPAANRRVLAGVFNAVSPHVPLFLSTDNALNWDASAISGLQAAGLRAIVADPTTAATVAGTRVYAIGRALFDPVLGINGGLYRSLDGGETWATIEGGLPATGLPPNRGAGIGRALVLDPRSCAAPPASGPCTTGPLRVAYAAGSGRPRVAPAPVGRGWRVMKTTNLDAAGGPTWVDVDGLPQPTSSDTPLAVALAIDPVNTQTVYVSTYQNRFPAVGTPTLPNGVFKSVDGGLTWTNASTGLPRLLGSATTSWDVMALAHHPTTSGILWAAATPLGDSSQPAASRIYKTTDGAATWVRSDTGIPSDVDLRALIVDPGAPDVLYAGGIGSAGNPGGVYRSSDGGATWRSISIGLPSAAVLALALDPVNANLLHAGTASGVWSLTQTADTDGDGAPNAQENNAPNAGDGNGDGTADSIQGDVGSTIVLFRAPQQGPRAPAGVVGCTGGFTTDVIGTTCPQAVDVSGLEAARFGRDFIAGGAGRAWQYPLDLVRFQLPNCAGAEVEVTFHLAGSDPRVCPDFTDDQWRFRFYGPAQPGVDASVGWHDFSSRATRVGPRKWRLRLDANQFGSYRPVSDSILFIGGPALNGERLFGDGFE